MQGNNQSQNSGNKQSNQSKPGLSWSQPQNKPAAGSQPQKEQPQAMKHAVTHTMPQKSNSGRKVLVVFGSLVALAIIIWAVSAPKKGQEMAGTATSTEEAATSTAVATVTPTLPTTPESVVPPTPVTPRTPELPTTSSTNATVSVVSPQDPGIRVAVEKLALTVPTWVVVYENRGGVPGNVLGAGLFFARDTSGVIELLRGTLPGQTYFVGTAQDDGDRIYSMQNDKTERDQSGNPILTQFQTR